MAEKVIPKLVIDCRMVTQDQLVKEQAPVAKCFFCQTTTTPYFIEAHTTEGEYGPYYNICNGCAEDIGNATMYLTELDAAKKEQGHPDKALPEACRKES